MDVAFGVVVLIIGMVVAYNTFADMINQWYEEDEEEEAYQRRRQQRQDEIDRQNQAIARRVLIEQCENIYIGNWKGEK